MPMPRQSQKHLAINTLKYMLIQCSLSDFTLSQFILKLNIKIELEYSFL